MLDILSVNTIMSLNSLKFAKRSFLFVYIELFKCIYFNSLKEKKIPFIKKYPMSILLAIIAINLMSIAGSKKPTAKLDQMKLNYAKWKGGQGIDLGKKYRLKGIMWDTWCKLYFTSS